MKFWGCSNTENTPLVTALLSQLLITVATSILVQTPVLRIGRPNLRTVVRHSKGPP